MALQAGDHPRITLERVNRPARADKARKAEGEIAEMSAAVDDGVARADESTQDVLDQRVIEPCHHRGLKRIVAVDLEDEATDRLIRHAAQEEPRAQRPGHSQSCLDGKVSPDPAPDPHGSWETPGGR